MQFGDYTWSRDNKDGVTLLDAIKEQCGNRIQINYAKGCDLVTDNRLNMQEAIHAAQRSDVCIVVIGSASASLARDYSNATCGEGFDLSDLTLTGIQEELVKSIHATGKPTIVVLLSGKPFAMPWIKENIPGILVQWYPGEQGGHALSDVLFGKVNPSGKLNFSFPQSVGHLPCHYNYLPTDKGFYRSPGVPNKPGKDYVFSSPKPLWAFGQGLSYTEFEYLAASTSKEDYQLNDHIEIKVTIRNAGHYDGLEVPQVYVRDLTASVITPIHELKAFTKIMIKKGETAQATLSIPVSELALYNKNMEKVVEPGAFELQIGRASDDIRIKKIITVDRNREKVIPLTKDKNKKATATNVISTPVVVKGTVRDVQANLLPQVTIKAGKKETVTDATGSYSLPAMSTDTLVVSGNKFKTERIPIEGRQVINIRLLNQ